MRAVLFQRPDGVVVQVMQWNALSIPNVAKWLRERDADFMVYDVVADNGWDEMCVAITNLDGTVVDYHEDELVVRIRRPEGDQWERATIEEWREFEPLTSSAALGAGT